MRRYVIEAIVLSLAASVVWWATRDFTAAATIAGAKGLHRLIGYPTPFLSGNSHHFYWFSPLFPPLVGLVLASRWLSWRRRLIGLLIGLCAFWYVVSVQLAVTFSPYLTLSAVRAYLMQVLISLNSVAVPVLLWLIVTGGPSLAPGSGARPGKEHKGPRPRPRLNLVVSVILAALLCAVITLPVQLAVEQSDPNLDAARNRLARAMLAENDVAALDAIEELLFWQGGKNPLLSYVRSQLLLRANQAASDPPAG